MELGELGVNGGSSWAALQEGVHNSVVQVVAQVVRFNWLEPYRVQEQFESTGSGFFIDNEGHVITNAHVVDEATTVWIYLPSLGKKTIFTDVVGFCPERDLALLRVCKSDWLFLKEHAGLIMPLPFGDSDLVRRTEPILVLGYPMGSYTMKSSTGVVSGRESYGGYSLIQITAPVNPGNSGGPLLNLQGEMIGITIATMIGAQNIGYAIPANELNIILDDLYKLPFVRRGMLGVLFNYASDEQALFFNNPVPAGVYVSNVCKDSLLERAGVCQGDMLYEFNGFCIDAFGDATVPWSRDKVSINDLVARLKNGDTVTLVVYRMGKRHEITFVFDVVQPNAVRRMYPHYETIEYEIIGGLVIMALAENHIPLLAEDMPYVIEYTKPDRKVEPVLVITHIIPGSMAQQQRNLEAGFIVAELNGSKVQTLDDLRALFTKNAEKDLLTIKTANDIFVVFPFKKMLEDEVRLSKVFSYPISSMIKKAL